MSQFIRAIEIDQTPNKLLFEYGSELAQQANLASQRQMALLKMKQEQDRDLSSKYGEIVKMSMDQMKGLTDEQANKAMESVKVGLASALNESMGDPNVFYRLGIDKALSEVVSYKASRGQIASAAADRATQLAGAGFRKDAIDNYGKRYMLDPSTANGFSVEKFNTDLDKEISDNPQLYMDEEKLLKAVSDRINVKGVDVERDIALDPTGTKKLTAKVKVPMKPWESLDKRKMPNGLEVEVPMIKTEIINGKNIITQDTYNRIIDNDPYIKSAGILLAKKSIHDINKSLGVNTATMDQREFAIAKAKNPALEDPYNEGNIDVFAKDAVTKMIKNNYNNEGFSVQGLQAYGSIKDNPPRTTFNVNTGSQNTKVLDIVGEVKALIARNKKELKEQNQPYKYSQVNLLPDGVQDVVLNTVRQKLPADIANKVGAESFKIKEYRGQPAVFTAVELLDGEGNVVRKAEQLVVTLGTSTNISGNKSGGTKAVNAAKGLESGGNMAPVVTGTSKTKTTKPANSGVKWK